MPGKHSSNLVLATEWLRSCTNKDCLHPPSEHCVLQIASKMSQASVLKLYDLAGAEEARRTSPFCWRVKLAIAYKGIPCESLPWRRVEKDMIAFSGQGKV